MHACSPVVIDGEAAFVPRRTYPVHLAHNLAFTVHDDATTAVGVRVRVSG